MDGKSTFKYDVKDFLKEKIWGVPEWVCLIIFTILLRYSPVGLLTGSISAYILVKWKRKKFFDKGMKDWKSTGGILFGANGTLIVIYFFVSFLISLLVK